MGAQDEEGLRGIPKYDHIDHESARRAAGIQPRPPWTPPAAAPAIDPILDSNIDIPLDRMSREFRKRAGRAFGLGDDVQAELLRDICKEIENFEKRFEKS